MMSNLNEEDIAKINEAAKEREITVELENVELSEEVIDFIENNPMTKTTVAKDLWEWSKLLTELSEKELKLLILKTDFNEKEYDILTTFDFKKKFGKDNDKVRKGYIREQYKDLLENIEDLELSIDYLKRRISFLKQLIHTKTILMEVKE